MNDSSAQPIYKAFGRLVLLHRKRAKGMTQEKLGRVVGLSRTSITNIERGRQHVALHQVFAIAEALNVPPSALLPVGSTESAASVVEKLPPTDRDIAGWVRSLGYK